MTFKEASQKRKKREKVTLQKGEKNGTDNNQVDGRK